MVILHYNQLKLHQTMPIVSFMHQLIRAVRRIFSPGGSKAYMPKKSQISRIINNDILKIVNIVFSPTHCVRGPAINKTSFRQHTFHVPK